MKTRFFLNLYLLTLLLVSCAPTAATETPAQPAAPVAVEASATSVADAIAPSLQGQAPAESTLEAAAPTPLPVATSRGPDLHATDPGTVNLTSGGLQFVEFFRFT